MAHTKRVVVGTLLEGVVKLDEELSVFDTALVHCGPFPAYVVAHPYIYALEITGNSDKATQWGEFKEYLKGLHEGLAIDFGPLYNMVGFDIENSTKYRVVILGEFRDAHCII